MADPGFSRMSADWQSNSNDRSSAARSAKRVAAVDPLLPFAAPASGNAAKAVIAAQSHGYTDKRINGQSQLPAIRASAARCPFFSTEVSITAQFDLQIRPVDSWIASEAWIAMRRSSPPTVNCSGGPSTTEMLIPPATPNVNRGATKG